MLAKTIIIVMMIIVLAALACGLVFLVRDDGKTRRTLRSLTWRVLISLSLFVFLGVAFHFHWITPHGIVATGAI